LPKKRCAFCLKIARRHPTNFDSQKGPASPQPPEDILRCAIFRELQPHGVHLCFGCISCAIIPLSGSLLAAALHRDSTQGLDPTHLNALVRWTHSSRRLQVEGPQHQTYFSGVTADCRTEYHTSAQVQWRATHADAATAHGRHDAIARATRQHVTDAAHGILSQRLQQHRLNPDTTTTTDAALLDRQHIVGTSLRFSVNGTSYHGTVVAVGACQHESNSKLTSRLAYIDVHASLCTSHIHTVDCIYTMPYDDAVYSQRHLSSGNLPAAEPLLTRGRSSTSSFSSFL
jgi:hypothetical protein